MVTSILSEDETGWLAETMFNRYTTDLFFISFFACVHARMHTNKHICKHAHMHMRARAHTHTHMLKHTHTCCNTHTYDEHTHIC